MATLILAPIAALIIQFAISRVREYKADADGAAILGNPLPLASALEKLAWAAKHTPMPGGCLSVVTALLGTPHEPDLRGTLLFLEDVGEPAYRLDRMLTQWLQSGRLARVAGIVVVAMAPARGETGDDVRRVFHAAGTALSVPVWYGFPAGHEGRNVALPFGVRARVDARGRLFLLESPVEGA